ncbi:WG repeat-containing protein [Pedobacter agri]|uniref:WG repeat-containing protein n=1 Tax=Pedobacter agri TaxID=454586 RepID=UPI0029313127|nr:WG repeat-containing protein [Pedobacter agri]
MKQILIIIITLLSLNKRLMSQEKIKPDLKIMSFLGIAPFKSESNALAQDLINMLYFSPQPKHYPKIGFMDLNGKLKIKPIYNMASDFYDGYANVIRDSTYGYIDKNGKETLFKQYEETYFYYGNTGIAKKDGKYGLIDRSGTPLTDFKYHHINFFGFNNFGGLVSKGYGHLLNSKGKIVFNDNLDYYIRSYFFEKDSLLVVQKTIDNKELQGIVNLKNQMITELIYDNIYLIRDKELILVTKNQKYGYVNKSGEVVIPIIYEQATFQITEDLICVKLNNKWGYINRKNETIIPFDYDEAYPFFSGKAFVGKDKLHGVIDANNKTVVDFTLEKTQLPFFSDNLSVYKKDNKYGYINQKGSVIISNDYDFANPFINKLAYVELNGKSGFINTKGKEIIPIKYNQLWLPSDKLIKFAE